MKHSALVICPNVPPPINVQRKLEMSTLPTHGRINCTACHSCESVNFDSTKTGDNDWRITANPLAWGNPNAEVVILGFSKGPTQAGALANTPHDDIAYKGSRLNVGKILAHVGLIPQQDDDGLRRTIDMEIANQSGRFHFGSLIRCTVERFDHKSSSWKGTGGGMLDKFVETGFGQNIARQCTTKFLSNLPDRTKLIVMFGMGTNQNYVREAFKLFKRARPGHWKWVNKVAYTDGKITVVHVEHFASQGALIPNWLGKNNHPRSQLGSLAQSAVCTA